MNSNLLVFFLSIGMVFIFCFAVFTNMEVKNNKNEILKIEKDIADLKVAIKRQKIEIASLTNPQSVLDYIKRNDLKALKLKNITTIYVED